MIPYARQSIDDADIAAVVEALKSPRITQGPLIGQFERRVAEYCGAKHAVAVANGTAALHVAALAAGLGPGDVGITSPLTFVASANCIAYTGAQVDFVDISPETLCIEVEALERRCQGERRGLPPPSIARSDQSHTQDRGGKPRGSPKAVVAVDFAGVPCDLPRLFALAQRYGFTLIEDAAHSLGASYRHEGREYRCGGCAHAHMATLSFHPVKAITTGEGGMVLTNDDALAARVRRLACHGIERDTERMTRNDGPWYYEMPDLGFNYRITDFQCALGLSQMDKLDAWIARRREIAARYNEAFRELAELPHWPKHTAPAFHLYVLRLTGQWQTRRREFFERLVERGIQPQVHYIPVHTQPFYRERPGIPVGDFQVAEDVYARCISLPMYPALRDAEMSQVIDAALSVLAER